MEHQQEELAEPVSPMGQYFNSSALCLYIIGVLEFEVPLHDLQALDLLKNLFLPISPRFSSIMVQDKDGEKRWKQVDVNLKDHVKTPKFPEGKKVESYEKSFLDYLSNISIEQLPQGKPLWEVHIVNYPTSNDSLGTVIFKLHHALGDGYSLMGALLSCLQRADDPSLPLSFPSLRPPKQESSTKSFWRKFSWTMSSAFNTASDLGWSILKSSIISDDITPIRSGDEGAEFRPISISSMEFSIDHIKDIKSRLGVACLGHELCCSQREANYEDVRVMLDSHDMYFAALMDVKNDEDVRVMLDSHDMYKSVNDVVTGIVFYGTRLYMQEMDSKTMGANSTALVLLNTRNIEGYQSIDEMLNAKKSKGPWGNKISFLHVPIPKLSDTKISNPLEFIWDSHNIIKRKKQSLAVALMGTLLDIESKLRGQEAVAEHMRRTVTNSSAVITNLVGPIQKMSLANHPVKGFYFTLAGGPESIVISIISYMGVLRVTLKTERDFIDEQKLKTCMQSAFEMILKAAMEIPHGTH